MSYTIRRAPAQVRETLELITADGQSRKTIEVELNIPRLAGELRPAILELTHAQEKIAAAAGRGGEEAQAAYDEAVEVSHRLLNLIFGPENTEELLSFFDRNEAELLQQVTPFIAEVVQPAVRGYISECRKRAVKGRRHAGRN